MFYISSRAVLKITVKNAIQFLNGLITADLKKLKEDGFLFSALLNSKGRFLYDFFIYLKRGEVFIDINKNCVDGFKKIIKYYDLLDEISIEKTNFQVFASSKFLLNWKEGNFEGRFLLENKDKPLIENTQSEDEYNLERIKLCLPEGFLELKQEKSIILEYGYEQAGAISFEKGCYIGQELITRTKRVGEVRKALYCIFTGVEIKTLEALSYFKGYSLLLGYKSDFESKSEVILEGKIYPVISSSTF
jgi:folate-binding protein YgfZ